MWRRATAIGGLVIAAGWIATRGGVPAAPTVAPAPASSDRGTPAPPPAPAPTAVEEEPVGDQGWVADTVREAMRRPGDSDRRLLDVVNAAGLAPGAVAWVGAAVDPWLGLGLLDLQRQASRRCERLTGDPGCWASADEAEEDLRDVLDDRWLATLEELRPR